MPLNQQYSMEFSDLIYIIIALLLAVVLFYIFIWLVPIIIVLIIAYVIYIFLKGPPDNYWKELEHFIFLVLKIWLIKV